MTPTELLSALLGALGGGGISAALTNYLLGSRRLKLDADAQTYERLLKEIGRLEGRADAQDKRADQCEARERVLTGQMAAQRMAFEREVGELKRDMAAIVRRSLCAVVTCDGDGLILSWNRAAEQLFGWNREEVEGRESIHILIPEERRAEHEAGFQRAMQMENYPPMTVRNADALYRDGSRVPVEVHLTRRRGPSGTWFFTAEITLR